MVRAAPLSLDLSLYAAVAVRIEACSRQAHVLAHSDAPFHSALTSSPSVASRSLLTLPLELSSSGRSPPAAPALPRKGSVKRVKLALRAALLRLGLDHDHGADLGEARQCPGELSSWAFGFSRFQPPVPGCSATLASSESALVSSIASRRTHARMCRVISRKSCAI